MPVVEQRYQAVLMVGSDVSVTAVAARFEVSRQSVHAWLKAYRADGLAGLDARSSRPVSSPWQAEAVVEAAVCQMRRDHPRLRISFESSVRVGARDSLRFPPNSRGCRLRPVRPRSPGRDRRAGRLSRRTARASDPRDPDVGRSRCGLSH